MNKSKQEIVFKSVKELIESNSFEYRYEVGLLANNDVVVLQLGWDNVFEGRFLMMLGKLLESYPCECMWEICCTDNEDNGHNWPIVRIY